MYMKTKIYNIFVKEKRRNCGRNQAIAWQIIQLIQQMMDNKTRKTFKMSPEQAIYSYTDQIFEYTATSLRDIHNTF